MLSADALLNRKEGNLLHRLNEFRNESISRLRRVINRGSITIVQDSNAVYVIKDEELQRAEQTIENLSVAWTIHDIPEIRLRLEEQKRNNHVEK